MITSKTGTSRIVWVSSPWEQLYKPSQRKRPTLPLKNKFNQSLPDSTTDSNSSNSRLQSLSLSHSIFIQSFLAFILPQSHIYFALFFLPFHLNSIQTFCFSFNTDTIIILPITTFSILVHQFFIHLPKLYKIQ